MRLNTDSAHIYLNAILSLTDTKDAIITYKANLVRASVFQIEKKFNKADSVYAVLKASQISSKENPYLHFLNTGLEVYYQRRNLIDSAFLYYSKTINNLEASSVKLTIYDVSGRVLKVVEGDYIRGYNEVPIKGSELAKGVMYYQLDTDSNTATKKMIMIK